MASRQRSYAEEQEIEVLGAHPAPIRDLYHQFLRTPWWIALVGLVAFYLVLNGCFALVYMEIDGLAGARPGSFADAYYFSVQTMGTIGYGVIYPRSAAANILVVAESVCGLLVTALATGLVFAKFSLSGARLVFTRSAVVAPMDGVPSLMVRLGNERSNLILEAQLRMVLLRTERMKEGTTFYRMYDLPLLRERSPALSRSWTVVHAITEASPLWGETPESLKQKEAEVIVSVVGTDDTSLQPVHARHRYTDDQILWGARHADVLSERPDGRLVLDLRQFHELTATEPTEGFPYSHGAKG